MLVCSFAVENPMHYKKADIVYLEPSCPIDIDPHESEGLDGCTMKSARFNGESEQSLTGV